MHEKPTNTPIIIGVFVGFSCIYQKAPETLPEDGNVMPKHVGATIHNKLNE
jgi:hypothetical protein